MARRGVTRTVALSLGLSAGVVSASHAQPLAGQTTAPAAASQPAPRPCESDANYRQFDFWIGEWDVQRTGVPRAPSGASSRVERALAGCVLIEHWTPPNGADGKSFNTYNRVSKRWEQYWVDTSGRITHYTGDFKNGNLYYEATQFGSTNRIRMTFEHKGPNEVRQFGELSTDGGKTWTMTFDLTYVRKQKP